MKTEPQVKEEFPVAYYNHGLTSDFQVYSVNSAESVVKIYVPKVYDREGGRRIAIVRVRVSGIHGEYATLPMPFHITEPGAAEHRFIPEDVLDITANAICSIMDTPFKGKHICERLFYTVARACMYVSYPSRVECDACLQDYIRTTKALYRNNS